MASTPLLPELSSQSSLLLAKIGEPSTNDLRLVVIETRPGGDYVETELGPAQSIEPSLQSRAFELTWWRYVAYSVRNESFCKPEDGQTTYPGPTGTSEDSAFLAYVSATSFASDDYPGPLTHWFVYTEWHCVDVVSENMPEVRELSAAEVSTLLEEGPHGRVFSVPGGPVH